MKARSREKKRVKKATVERRVQSTRMVVKMNQPCIVGEHKFDPKAASRCSPSGRDQIRHRTRSAPLLRVAIVFQTRRG